MRAVIIGLIITTWLLGATAAAADGANTGSNVRRTIAGICYTRGQEGYREARSYKAFDSIEACIKARGRLPSLTGFGRNEPSPAPVASAVPVAAPAPVAVTTAVEQRIASKRLFDTDDPSIVKKARDGICHDVTSASFTNTLHFEAFRTLQDCLQSGGRTAE